MDLVFDWFLICILKCFIFCNRRAKEFKVSKYFAKYICSVRNREVRGSSIVIKYLVEANLHLAVRPKFQSELNIPAILLSRLNYKKEIKVEIP